jgi:hypothetical protein
MSYINEGSCCLVCGGEVTGLGAPERICDNCRIRMIYVGRLIYNMQDGDRLERKGDLWLASGKDWSGKRRHLRGTHPVTVMDWVFKKNRR